MPVPRAGLSTDGVVDVALAIVDEQGPEALSLSVVAARAGVAAPSLYKHVAGLTELRSRVAARVLAEMTEVANAAVLGLSGDAAIAALMRRLRAYGMEHPARYPAPARDRPRVRLDRIQRRLRPGRGSSRDLRTAHPDVPRIIAPALIRRSSPPL